MPAARHAELHPHPQVLRTAVLTAALVLSAGPAAPAADSTNHLVVRGEERTFILHLPPSYDESTAAAVLFMFHGLNSDAQAAASSYYNWKATADNNGFIVVFPDSLTPPGKNIEFPPGTILYTNYDGTGKRWDIAHVFATNRCDSQDIDFVLAILDWLQSNYNIRASHVFASGHSYGAFFSYYCAVCLPEQITAFAEHSGGLYEYQVIPEIWSIWWPIDVPASPPELAGMLLHSTGDTVVGYSNSLLLAAQMDSHAQMAELVSLPESLGHNWDSSRNQTQWNFFLEHAPMIDDDGDGMADPWESTHGLDPQSPDGEDDPDGDGMSNLQEYLADTHPLDPSSALRMQPPGWLGDDAILIRWSSSTNRTYELMYSTNLMQGFQPLASNLPGRAPENVYTDSPGASPRFYRVRTAP